MNNLMTRKKKYRYTVELKVEDLQHVPLLNEELYAKVRLLDGGFTARSQSIMVKNHTVQWDEPFKFACKMTANATSGELDTCFCRVSVRQEVRGGKSFQKLGYADVNLAQFPGSRECQFYLLEAYNYKHRLHNSTLRVRVTMTLLSGDPCVKAQPWPRQMAPTVEEPSEATNPPPPHNRPTTGSLGSINSLNYNSLDKKKKAEEAECQQADQAGHSRNSSNTSCSGYASNASHSDKSAGHARSGSQGSSGCISEGGSLERPALGSRVKAPSHSDANKDPRVVETREDTHDTINQIFEAAINSQCAVQNQNAPQSSGLQLYLKEDGTPSVRAGPTSSGEFKPIILSKR